MLSSFKSICCIPNNDDHHSGKRKYQCRCLHGLNKQKQCDDNTNSNDDHSCAVVVRAGPHGLHVFSSRNIKAGSVIIQCLPLAHSILVPPGTSPLDECDNNDDGRRRCTRCFFREGDIDASGWRRKKFGRCSKCQVTYYCSRSCQAEDWDEQHKLECKYYVNLHKRRSTDYSASSAEEDAVPLLLRTFNKLKFMRDNDNNEDQVQVKTESSGMEIFQHEDTLVTCGPEHFARMASSTSISNVNELLISSKLKLAVDLMGSHAIRGKTEQSTTDAALTIWGYNHEHDNCDTNCQGNLIFHAIRRTLNAFQKNNFGIVNSLHSTVGEGVYPCAALLNHSCDPNCILRYKFGIPVANNCGDEEEGLFHSPILQIIACKDIIAGEELCHSYVDLALTTKARQSRLFETHGFICDCKRCVVGGCSIDLPTNRGDWDLWPLRNGLRTSGENDFVDDSECLSLINIQLDDAMIASNGYSESELHTMNHQSDVLRQKARQSMIGDDTAGELQCLKDAIEIYSNKRNDRWLSPFLFELYSLRCEYLSALLANGRILDGLEQCEHIVSFLAVAFSHVGCHPLLGLQLFTLGDLYSGVSTLSDTRSSVEDVGCHKKKAKAAFLWAKKVMLVTHGESDHMVMTLNDNLSIL